MGVLVVSFITFSPSLAGYFHEDDWLHLLTSVNERWWTTFYGDWFSGIMHEGGFYRPLIRLSIVFNKALCGHNAFGYHLTNLLIHLINVWLIICIARLLLPEGGKSFAIIPGILFGVFPIHHQSVFWISGRTDLLAGLFAFATILFILQFLEHGQPRFYSLSLICAILALLSKEVSIAIPPIIIAALLIFGSIKGKRALSYNILSTLVLIYIILGLLIALFVIFVYIPEIYILLAVFLPLFLLALLHYLVLGNYRYPALLYIHMTGIYIILTIAYFVWRRFVIGPLPMFRIFDTNIIMETYHTFFSFLYFPLRTTEAEFSSIPLAVYIVLPLIALAISPRRWLRAHVLLLLWLFLSIFPMSGYSVSLRDGQRLLYVPTAAFVLFWSIVIKDIISAERLKNFYRQTSMELSVAITLLTIFFAVHAFRESLTWLDYSNKTRKVVHQSCEMISALDIPSEEFSIAVLNLAPAPQQIILDSVESFAAALRVMGNPSWDITVYFDPEQLPHKTWVLTTSEDYEVTMHNLEAVDIFEWESHELLNTWMLSADVTTSITLENEDGYDNLLRVEGSPIVIESPPLYISGWLLLSLYYRIDTEALGLVAWHSEAQNFNPLEHESLLFNDVGMKFSRRDIPLGYMEGLEGIHITLSNEPAEALIGAVRITRYVLGEGITYDGN